MSDIIFVQDAVVDFLRKHINDPQTKRTYTFKSETFTGDGTTTEFNLAPDTSLQWVDNVSVAGADKTKWQDYWIDFQNQKIIFFTAPSGTVIVDYHQGTTDWIYPDRPNPKLSRHSYPRVAVNIVDGVAKRLGQYNTDVESYIRFQVDIFTKESQQFVISNKTYEGEALGIYIGNKILEAFRNHESELHPLLYSYECLRIPTSLGFNVDYQAFHIIVEFSLNTINQGEV